MPDRNGQGATRDGQNVSLVHDRLREEILAGNIPAGETSQVALARDLGVGRTPLREALRMLQREGLVISEPNRRVRIAELSPGDAEELYVMRTGLEYVAIQITVSDLDSDGVAELEGLMAQMDHYMRRRDAPGMRGPHRAFHGALVAGAGERVATMVALLFDHAERYRVAFGATTPTIWEKRRAEHRAILDAVSEGDADLAARRLLEHYGSTAGLIFKGLDPDYDPVRLRAAMESLAPGSTASLDV
jgi:DNA-binding GntR family transcriptional regulator